MSLILISGIVLLFLVFSYKKVPERKKEIGIWFLVFGILVIAIQIIINLFPAINTILISKYHDAITNKNGETKWLYSIDEEVFSREVSIKILSSSKYKNVSFLDREELNYNNSSELKEKNVNVDNSCFLTYQKNYQGVDTGNVVTQAIFTKPTYIYIRTAAIKIF